MLTTRIVPTVAGTPALLGALRRLLDDAYDGDFSDDDWKHTLGGWHAVVSEGERLLSHAAVVPRTLEIDGRPLRSGYVEGVATAPDRRGEGLGSWAMSQLMDELRSRFVLGAHSPRIASRSTSGSAGNVGRVDVPARGHHVTSDPGGGRRDHGAAPRFRRDLDLRAAITCAARTGDDW